MKKIRVLSVFGTRPDAIKMAPMVIELKKCAEIESLCCVTAQHREMLDSVLGVFGLDTDFDLNIMEESQSLETVMSKAICGLKPVYDEVKPDIVLVHGDTTTSFAASLAAFYAKIKVGHVEAGLRSFNKYSPYPEEINRKLTAVIANLHFCPTQRNAENLRDEGVRDGIFVTGNTEIDALKYTVKKDFLSSHKEINALDFKNKRVIAMTCHRRENYDSFADIFSAIKTIAQTRSDVQIVYPVHMSPVVQKAAHSILGGIDNVTLLEHLDAQEMHNLLAQSYFVMTDSGGIQEDAPALGKPVLVMRRETERPEAVEAGTVKLAGVEYDGILNAALELLDDEVLYTKMAKSVNPYGDGNACERIKDALLWDFGISEKKPEEFAAR